MGKRSRKKKKAPRIAPTPQPPGPALASKTSPARPASAGAGLDPSHRRYWLAMGGLILVHLLLVWTLPLLPAQDLPQHLAYARIMMDYDQVSRFQEFYQLPESYQTYFATYYIMAFLGQWITILGAARLLYSLYVIAVPLGLHFLVRACHPPAPGKPQPPPWSALLGVQLIWSPVACMGFLAFTLSVPALIFAVAAFVRWWHQRGRREAALAFGLAGLLAGMHIVAAGFYVIFVALFTLLSFQRRSWVVGLTTIGVALVSFGLWGLVSEVGRGSWPSWDYVVRSYNTAHGLEFLNHIFRFRWEDPVVKTSYALWAVFGPYRLKAILGIAVVALAGIYFVIRALSRAPASEAPPTHRAYKRAAIAFGVLTWLVPWGVYVPTELTFFDFRMMTVAVALLAALVRPTWFRVRAAQTVLITCCALLVVHFGVRAVGFNREARHALELLEQVDTKQMLMTLPYHNRTLHFGKQFRLSHFLPLYFTVFHGGTTSQFWARYTHHLPIDYKPGKRPRHTTDWHPWKFQPADLKDSGYLLLQAATETDSDRMQKGYLAATEAIKPYVKELRCSQLWCLYRITSPPSSTREGAGEKHSRTR